MSKSTQNKFITGLISGAVLTLVVGAFLLKSGSSSYKNQPGAILAEFDGGSLSRSDLEKKLAGRLAPAQNDQYVILNQGIEEWLESQLIEKEAKSKNLSSKDLYVKEIWGQVRISPNDALEHYRKNADLYAGQTYEKIAPLLSQKLRLAEYEKIKQNYLGKLREKYRAKVHLEKPDLFVAGLGMGAGEVNPLDVLAGPAAAAPQQAPAQVPQAPKAPVVFTDLGGRPSVGPDNAPVTLVEFSDFMCPFCSKVGPTLDQLMKSYPGKIRRVWRHYPLPFHKGADRVHMASECAHEQGKFWPFHDNAFAAQSSLKDESALLQIAEKSGLDKSKFQACLASDKYKNLIQQEITKGSGYGVSGTPAFFINGRLLTGAQPYQSFANAVESFLDPSKANLFPQAPTPQAPKPAPTNVQFSDLAGRPSAGPEKAPITLVIFSDFHCPFCKRVEPTIDQLMKNYAGKIRKVWRHYPLPFHQGADRTAEASECAHEQGKFWEYHAKLFETMGGSRDDASLNQLAEQVKLDKNKFQQCLASGKYKELVKKDLAKGSEVGVNGTPAVFVNGQLVSGAQPYENFDTVVKSKLSGK